MNIETKVASLLIFVLLALAGCSTPGVNLLDHFSGIKTRMGKPFIIVQTERDFGWGVLSHPFIGHHDTGEPVYLRYNLAGDHGAKPSALKKTRELGPAYSRDGGQTWLIGSQIPMDEVGFKSLIGRVDTDHGVYRFGGINRKSMTIRAVWIGRETTPKAFFAPIHLGFEPIGIVVRVMNRGIYSSDGRIILSAFAKRRGEEEHAFTLVSSDDGQSFRYGTEIASHEDYDRKVFGGPSENEMIRSDNGDIICVIRTGRTKQYGAHPIQDAYPMLIARSKDEGLSWDVEKLNFSGVNPNIKRMRNGLLVLAYGRPGNVLRFSDDDGKTWKREIALTAPDLNTSGYVAIAEVSAGRLLAVYDSFSTTNQKFWLWSPPQKVNTIYGVFIDVELN